MNQSTDGTIDWLLEGDPAIRWQTLRDLVAAPERRVAQERKRVAHDGWGAQLLAKQDREGSWARGRGSAPDSGLYTPKWISTTYTMLLLRDCGLPPNNRQAHQACKLLLDCGLQPDGGISYGTWARWTRRGETCITGMVLSLLAYFNYNDDRLDGVVKHLSAEQMADGGWNCRRQAGATHASLNTTISVLEALRLYEINCGRQRRLVQAAQRRGRDFLLVHRLFRSHHTGEIIKPAFTRFAFPPRWHYDVLRGLDHFRDVDAPRDPRLADAIGMVRQARNADGRWLLQQSYPGKTWFEMERRGAPSRWNTLRARRVLQWWDQESK